MAVTSTSTKSTELSIYRSPQAVGNPPLGASCTASPLIRSASRTPPEDREAAREIPMAITKTHRTDFRRLRQESRVHRPLAASPNLNITGAGHQAGKVVTFHWKVLSGPRTRTFDVLAVLQNGSIKRVNKRTIPGGANRSYSFVAHHIKADVDLFYLDANLASGTTSAGPLVVTVHRLSVQTTGKVSRPRAEDTELADNLTGPVCLLHLPPRRARRSKRVYHVRLVAN